MIRSVPRVLPNHPPAQRRNSHALFFVIEGFNALATPYLTSYIFFLLRDHYGFGNVGNLATAALGGLVYGLAAWQGGRFAQRFGYFTSLKTGFGVMAICLALGPLVPSLAAVILTYACCMAAVCFTWPALEALISDGVGDDILPKNVGIYNMVWSAGAALMYFVGGTLYERLGHDSIFWLPALVHCCLYLFILRLGPAHFETPSPAPAAETPRNDVPASTPAVSPEAFLRMVWLANPFSYVAINTVTAFIPTLAQKLEMSTTQAGLFCSIWMFIRMATFVALWQWTGWHYRFRWLLGAFVGLIAGFSLLLLSTNLGILVGAEVIFGVSIGLIYYSSLFYSMDVGSETKGEHGGLHEAMIGAGNCLGPAVGALSLCLAPSFPNAGAYTVTALLACGLAGLVGLRARWAE